MKPTLESNVPGYVGPCVPVWVNRNQVYHRLDGGITGFFRLVKKRWFGRQKVGEEFHGIIRGAEVESTGME
jgi:hypothetical protein